MVNIHVLTQQLRLGSSLNDFYPLIRWQEAFARQNIRFRFFASQRARQLHDCDILILDYRYFQKLLGSNVDADQQHVVEFVLASKARHTKVVLFDSADGTDSRCFVLTPYLDVHLKKQLLKDLSGYTAVQHMVWVPAANLVGRRGYQPCGHEHLSKLRLGWNIGLVDYAARCRSRLPALDWLSRWLHGSRVYASTSARPLLCSFRGAVLDRPAYMVQRSKVLQILQAMAAQYPVGFGLPVSRRAYLREVQRSRAIVSPYGWGEICYRDFECFIHGAVLVKPRMDHLTTFPDLYIPEQTYVPIEWDLRDLEARLIDIDKNFAAYEPVALRARSMFNAEIADGAKFISHFKQVVLN